MKYVITAVGQAQLSITFKISISSILLPNAAKYFPSWTIRFHARCVWISVQPRVEIDHIVIALHNILNMYALFGTSRIHDTQHGTNKPG